MMRARASSTQTALAAAALPTRVRLAVLATLACALSALALPTAAAQAKSCTTQGSERVCFAIQRESCSPGRPYRCRTARDEQHYRDGRFTYSQYKARRRTCFGFGGTRCRLDYTTFCTTTPSSKRCRTDSGTTCRGGRVTKCFRTIDSCFTRRGYSCRFTKVEERCSDRICRTTRTICNSSGRRGKHCYARFSHGPGRLQDDADDEEEAAGLPFFEDDGSLPPDDDPSPAPAASAPACATSTTTTTTLSGETIVTTSPSC